MFLNFCFVHFFLQGTSCFHTHGDDTFIYLFIFTTTRTHTRNPSFPDGLAECHISYLAVSTYIFEMDIPCDTTISLINKLLGFHGFVVYRSHVHIKVPPEARKLLLATRLFVRFHHRSWTGI